MGDLQIQHVLIKNELTNSSADLEICPEEDTIPDPIFVSTLNEENVPEQIDLSFSSSEDEKKVNKIEENCKKYSKTDDKISITKNVPHPINNITSSANNNSSGNKKKNDSELEEKLVTAIHVLTSSIMQRVQTEKHKSQSNSDEAFFRYLSETFSELPKRKRERAKLDIMNVLYKLHDESD